MATLLLWSTGLPVPGAVTLTSSAGPEAPVGAKVTWTVESPNPETWYRFRVYRPDGTYRTIRDFGPVNHLDWTAADWEGLYSMEVTAQDRTTGGLSSAWAPVRFVRRVSNEQPVISPTDHPLVMLYSAPECELGWQMRVEHVDPEGLVYRTPFRACRDGLSMNFYIAGLRAGASYRVRHVLRRLNDPSVTESGPEIEMDMPELPERFRNLGTMSWRTRRFNSGVVLHGTLQGDTIGTDPMGRLVWFYPEYLSAFTRANGDGTFLGLVQDGGQDESYQVVREFDVAGYTVAETNAARVNEQLVKMGFHPICSFHHEAIRLRDGRLVVLASSERLLTDVQDPGEVNVLGDTVVVLDRDLQVVWAWDSFDHLDVRRKAIYGNTCTSWGPGCPPFYQSERANDWTHANSVRPTSDGHLVISLRHQDWVIKINYANGTGDGQVLWRLGKEGDFTYESEDPYPWFSHQHDAGFVTGESNRLLVFDNGNVRCDAQPSDCNSRGQVIELDEERRVARLALNMDLMTYSFALGSAQRLSTGEFAFGIGILPDRTSMSVLFNARGEAVHALTAEQPVYRSVWMRDLFTLF